MTDFDKLWEWYKKKSDRPYNPKDFKTEAEVKEKIKNLLDFAKSQAATKKQKESLDNENLKTSDIDCVFVTHYHPDHCALMGIFENATIYDSVQWQNGPLGTEPWGSSRRYGGCVYR